MSPATAKKCQQCKATLPKRRSAFCGKPCRDKWMSKNYPAKARPCGNRSCAKQIPPERRTAVYCSPACRPKAEPPPRLCEACKGPIPAEKRSAKFCSDACWPACRGKRDPRFAEVVKRSQEIGPSAAAHEYGLTPVTVRHWRQLAGMPLLRPGRPRSGRPRLSEEERGAGPLPCWCKWCGDPLPKGEEYCDDECRTEDVIETRRSA